MLLIDENKLSKGAINAIGESYGINYDFDHFTEDSYDEHIDKVVERFYVGDKKEVIDFLKKI